MAFRCSAGVSVALERWVNECRRQTGKQNEFLYCHKPYTFEVINEEFPDGHVIGDVFQVIDESCQKKIGTFVLSATGTLYEAPRCLRTMHHRVSERVFKNLLPKAG